MQYFENQPVRGFQSSVEPVLLIGLGQYKQVDSLRVVWPGGNSLLLQDVPVNQTLRLQAPQPVRIWNAPENTPVTDPVTLVSAQPAAQALLFNEKLVPWFLNTQGPAFAVADVNGDGRGDCLAVNKLYLQDARGRFKETDLIFGQYITASALFDADVDGDSDL